MNVIKYEKESVLIKDGKIKAWIDVWIADGDVICDWNQNVFFKTDKADIALKKWQEDLANFEVSSSLAIRTLEKERLIFQDRNSKWHTFKK